MADKAINELQVAQELYDDSLLVVEQQREARSITGALVKKYARASAAEYVDSAKDSADAAGKSAEEAKMAEQGAAESLSQLNDQVERAETARDGAEKAKQSIEDMTVGAESLPTGEEATVTKSTDESGVTHLQFGLPKGDTGEQGEPGVSPTVDIQKENKTTTITITDETGPHYATILDGEDGAGNVDSIIKAAALAAHPVGSYYMSNDPTDPTELFGGTWVAIKDKMIMAAGDSFQAGESGGAESTTTSDSSAVNTGSTTVSVASSGGSTTGGTAITIAQMPVHNHGFTGASHSHGILDSEHVIMQAKPALGTAYFLTMTNGSSGTKYEHMIRFSDDTSTAGGKLGPSNMRGTQAATAGGTVANAGSGAAHTHTTPAHTHTLENGAHTHTMSHTHTVDTLPPYIVAYVWQRTA